MQRFRDGFTAVPPMRTLGDALGPRRRRRGATRRSRLGWTIGSELRAHGVDFSFTPVLDLDFGASTVIGDRAFHRNPNAVAHLAAALHAVCAPAACRPSASTFPVTATSRRTRTSTCRSTRATLAAIAADDLVPFAAMAAHGPGGG